MSVIEDMESVEREIRELILHSKSKRLTIFEPCCKENLPKYLKSIREELSVFSIKFMFDPHRDLEDETEREEALVRLVNATWNLILVHKEVAFNGEKLKERNYALQQNNFFLNNMVDKLKMDFELNDVKLKQAEEKKRQTIVALESARRESAKTTEDLKRYKKQLTSKDTQNSTEMKRMERNYALLQDKFRGQCGMYTSKNEAKNTYVDEYKARERKYKEMIAKLQENNRQLLLEVVNLKEDLLADDSGDDR